MPETFVAEGPNRGPTVDIAAERPRRAPTHPGQLLRNMVIPALEMPITEAARQLGVTRQQLHRVLAEECDVSAEMAVRLGKFCGNGAELWLRMQMALDLWRARQKLGAALDAIPTAQERISSEPTL